MKRIYIQPSIKEIKMIQCLPLCDSVHSERELGTYSDENETGGYSQGGGIGEGPAPSRRFIWDDEY